MTITNEQLLFSVLWVALMLIYLLGDVIRIFAGDFTSGEIDGQKVPKNMWLIAAVIMLIPIIMVVLNVIFETSSMKWPNIILSGFFIIFNVSGLKGYKFYDQFLLGVSFILNIFIIYIASTF